MSRTLTVTIPDTLHPGEVSQFVSHVGGEVEGGLTSGHDDDGASWTIAQTSPTAAPTPPPATVWLAVDLFPESMEVLVADDRDGALNAVKATIKADEWQQFQNSLARNNEPGANLTLAAPAAEVLQHYWGDFEDASEHGPGAVYVGEGWLVRPANVATRPPS